jgi:hypothetical protein
MLALGSIGIWCGIRLPMGASEIKCRSRWNDIQYGAKSPFRCQYKVGGYPALDASHDCPATLTTHHLTTLLQQFNSLRFDTKQVKVVCGMI